MEYKFLICDDQPLHLDILERNLGNYLNAKNINYMCKRAETGKEVIKQFKQYEFNIIFLDIGLPDMKGTDISKKLRNINKDVLIIFVTSYDNYKTEAFKQFAFNYIDKPINVDEFNEIMDKALEKINMRNYYINEHKKIKLETTDKVIELYFKDILYFESKGKNSLAYTYDNKKYLVKLLFKELENVLDNSNFLKCHRSYIININKVACFNTTTIKLINLEREIPIGRKFKENVFSIIDKKL